MRVGHTQEPGYSNFVAFNIKMKKYEQLENQIKELQAEVERLKREEKLPTSFSRSHALEFLNNPTSKNLDLAFVWSETPQGEDYWLEIESALSRNPSYKVPQEAINQIQSWVIESYKQQYGV